jgi:hypothetical protein
LGSFFSTILIPQAKAPANNFPHEIVDDSLPNSPAARVADQPIVQEKTPLPAALEVKPTASTTSAEERAEHPDSREKTALCQLLRDYGEEPFSGTTCALWQIHADDRKGA